MSEALRDLTSQLVHSKREVRRIRGRLEQIAAGSSVIVSGSTNAHGFLSSSHSDTLSSGPTRGALVVGNSTPKWSRLPIGLIGTILSSDGFDASWRDNLYVRRATLGQEVARLESVATNDDPFEAVYQNRVATADATPTTLHTFAIAASKVTTVEVVVLARRTGGTAGTADDAASYRYMATYKNVAGTPTLIDTVTPIHVAEDQDWDVSLTVSGSNVLVVVTGAVDNNIVWHATARLWSVGS